MFDKLKSLYSPTKPHVFILTVLMALFIIFRIEMPRNISGAIDSIAGRVVLLVLVVGLFTIDPVLGVVSMVAGFVMLHRATEATGTYAVNNYLPTQKTKDGELSAFNQFTESLEEEIVKKLVPFGGDRDHSSPSYKPVLDDLHSASVL